MRRKRAPREDRVLMVHGPVVRRIIVAQAFSLSLTVVGIIWLALSVAGKADKATERSNTNAATIAAVQESRTTSVFYTCKDLQIVIRVAALMRGHPRSGEEFLSRTGLKDCREHARSLTALPNTADVHDRR